MSGERKKDKYTPLQEQAKARGWNVTMWAVEVGCKGFPAASLGAFLKDLGIAGEERNRRQKKIGEEAEYCSRKIWYSSHFTRWGKKE